MSTVRNLVAIAKGGETSAGAGGAAATTGTLNWTCPSSLPSTAHKKEKKKGKWPSSSPGKGVSRCTVSIAFQAGPISHPLSTNWNPWARLLSVQGPPQPPPVTSIRKGAPAFSGWSHCLTAAAALLVKPALPLQEESRDRIRIRLLTTSTQATGYQRVWSGRELRSSGSRNCWSPHCE